ncbi:hypothetical protein LTR85_004713 [Meristemomyces frigidus]|nr:hypothetical protein LTR85_004713 [Meristemomyces frigidus]
MRYSSIVACLAAGVFAAPIQNEARALSDIPAMPTTTPAAGYASAVLVNQEAIATLEGVQSQASTPDPAPLLTTLIEIAEGVIETFTLDMAPLQGVDAAAISAQLASLLTADQATMTQFRAAMAGPSVSQAQFQSAVAGAVSGFKAALAGSS